MNPIVQWLLEAEDGDDIDWIDWKEITPLPPTPYGKLDVGTVIFVRDHLEVVDSKIEDPGRPPQVRLLTYRMENGLLKSDFTRAWQRDLVKGELVGIKNELPMLRKVLLHMLHMTKSVRQNFRDVA